MTNRRWATAVMGALTMACCACSDSSDASSSNAQPKRAQLRVLCLGDSYTIGEGVDLSDGFPAHLVRGLRETHGLAIADPVIVARTGWTADELLAGIDAAHPGGTFDLVTLLIGVNDQYRGHDVESFRAGFVRALERALGFAGGNARRVVVLSIPDWGDTPFAAGRDRARIASEIDAYNAVVATQTASAGAAFVDITAQTRDLMRRPDAARTLLVADGLHPSGEVYAAWAAATLPESLRALRAPHR